MKTHSIARKALLRHAVRFALVTGAAAMAAGSSSVACSGGDAATASDASAEDAGTEAGGDAVADAASERTSSDGATVGDSASDTSIADAGAAPPDQVEPASLKLWLRADRGMTCTAGHVAQWLDQSAAHDDATPVAGHVGPACGGAQALNGIDVPAFQPAALGGLDAAIAEQDDGVLQLDLSFLVGAAYTLFVVERRTSTAPDHNFFLGSGVFPAQVTTCAPNQIDSAIHIGYRHTFEFTTAQFCDDYEAVLNGGVQSPIDVIVNPGGGASRSVYFGDVAQTVTPFSSTQTPNAVLTASAGGRLGRGYLITGSVVDTRYYGIIAEVVAYTAVLTDTDRSKVTAYLKTHWAL